MTRLDLSDLPDYLIEIATSEKRPGKQAWPSRFFNGPDGKRRLRAIIDCICEIEGVQPNGLTTEILKRYSLIAVTMTHYDSIFGLVDSLWPGRYEPWEFDRVSYGLWEGEEGLREAARATWWLSARLQKPLERLTARDFSNAGLGGMLVALFAGQPHRARKNADKSADKPVTAGYNHLRREFRRRAATNCNGDGALRMFSARLPEDLYVWLRGEAATTPGGRESMNDIIVAALRTERKKREEGKRLHG